jgi:DNA-binding FrmR family transcriptional regulator
MLEADEYCCDILTQLTATRSALDQVGAELVASHVRTCIAGTAGDAAHSKAKKMSDEELMDELRIVLSRLVK